VYPLSREEKKGRGREGQQWEGQKIKVRREKRKKGKGEKGGLIVVHQPEGVLTGRKGGSVLRACGVSSALEKNNISFFWSQA